MPETNWDDLRYLLAAARAESFAAAARQLGVNESTVARRIAQAERRLGARLFERVGGRLAMTAAGVQLLRRAELMEREVQAAEAELSGADRRAAGLVRITAVPLLVNRVLLPALPGLLAAHPHLQIELIAEPRDLSLTRREADIALRLARPQKELRALARRVGELDYAVYGPAAAGPDEALPWITYEDSLRDLPQARWIAAQIAGDPEAAPQLLVNDAEAILAGLKAGLGKSLLPTALGARDPALKRLGDCPPGLTREVWLMVHPDLKDLVRSKVVTKWLTTTVVRFLEGEVG
jgi:DNA-binding transcriptional LysR family regulator